jgi:hypothetical protein
MESKRRCSVCGAYEGEPRTTLFGEGKRTKVYAYHVIPPSWNPLPEFKKLTVLLCTRCNSCCPPNIIARWNHALSHEVTRVLNDMFPELLFEIRKHDCGDPKCPDRNSYFMDINVKKHLTKG